MLTPQIAYSVPLFENCDIVPVAPEKSEYHKLLDFFYFNNTFTNFMFNLIELSLLNQKELQSFNKENRVIRVSGPRQIGHTLVLYKLLMSFCRNKDCLIIFHNENAKSHFIKNHNKVTMPNYDLRTSHELLFLSGKKYDFILVDTASLISQQHHLESLTDHLKQNFPGCLVLLG